MTKTAPSATETYTYGDAARPDRLTNMTDAADAVKGFKYTSGAAAYQYDASGNLTQDNHKGFTFGYHYLNLPQNMTQGANVITLTYSADGEKLSKTLTGGGATKSYVSGIEYSGANLEAIYFSEGRCTPNGVSFEKTARKSPYICIPEFVLLRQVEDAGYSYVTLSIEFPEKR